MAAKFSSTLLALLLCLPLSRIALAGEGSGDSFSFDDTPLENVIVYPKWFKQSFLALDEDLQEAIAKGKDGIIVYFGQQRCPYCKKLMDINFQQDEIVEYTRKHFDVIPIDIWSPEEVTTPDGRDMTERDYAVALNTNFTPSLVFYDKDARIALRLRGYYPPYQHQAALEYVADGHYRKETFASYLERGDKTLHFEPGDLIEDPCSSRPPTSSIAAVRRPICRCWSYSSRATAMPATYCIPIHCGARSSANHWRISRWYSWTCTRTRPWSRRRANLPRHASGRVPWVCSTPRP